MPTKSVPPVDALPTRARRAGEAPVQCGRGHDEGAGDRQVPGGVVGGGHVPQCGDTSGSGCRAGPSGCQAARVTTGTGTTSGVGPTGVVTAAAVLTGVAAVVGAHGIAGEVRLKLFTDDLAAYPNLEANGRSLTLETLRPGPNGAVARFARHGMRHLTTAIPTRAARVRRRPDCVRCTPRRRAHDGRPSPMRRTVSPNSARSRRASC